jgi:hypothetical protein
MKSTSSCSRDGSGSVQRRRDCARRGALRLLLRRRRRLLVVTDWLRARPKIRLTTVARLLVANCFQVEPFLSTSIPTPSLDDDPLPLHPYASPSSRLLLSSRSLSRSSPSTSSMSTLFMSQGRLIGGLGALAIGGALLYQNRGQPSSSTPSTSAISAKGEPFSLRAELYRAFLDLQPRPNPTPSLRRPLPTATAPTPLRFPSTLARPATRPQKMLREQVAVRRGRAEPKPSLSRESAQRGRERMRRVGGEGREVVLEWDGNWKCT